MTTISDIKELYPNLTEVDTGGGCKALSHPCDDGGHLLLTVDDVYLPTDEDDVIQCGVYDADRDPVGDVHEVRVDELEAWIDAALAAHR